MYSYIIYAPKNQPPSILPPILTSDSSYPDKKHKNPPANPTEAQQLLAKTHVNEIANIVVTTEPLDVGCALGTKTDWLVFLSERAWSAPRRIVRQDRGDCKGKQPADDGPRADRGILVLRTCMKFSGLWR